MGQRVVADTFLREAARQIGFNSQQRQKELYRASKLRNEQLCLYLET
jgi:hypothetical protein